MNETDEIVLSGLKVKPQTRGTMVELTGIPRSTLHDSLLRLRIKNLVKKYSDVPTRPGRPKVFFELII